jgi:hypothetical protein
LRPQVTAWSVACVEHDSQRHDVLKALVNRPGIRGGSNRWEDGVMSGVGKGGRYPDELRERAVRMVFDHAHEYRSQ